MADILPSWDETEEVLPSWDDTISVSPSTPTTQEVVYEAAPSESDAIAERLPTTVRVGFGDYTVDTGIELGKKPAAFLTGMGSGMTSLSRGMEQLFGGDTEELQKQEQYMRELRGDPELGASAIGGEITGAFVEPVGLAFPVAKIAKLGKLGTILGVGATSGAIGALDYAPEESALKDWMNEGMQAELSTRQVQAITGVVGGGVLTAAFLGSGKAVGWVMDYFSSGKKLSDAELSKVLKDEFQLVGKDTTEVDDLASTINGLMKKDEWKELDELAMELSKMPEVNESDILSVMTKGFPPTAEISPKVVEAAEKLAAKINAEHAVSTDDLLALKEAHHLYAGWAKSPIVKETGETAVDVIDRLVPKKLSKRMQTKADMEAGASMKAAIKDDKEYADFLQWMGKNKADVDAMTRAEKEALVRQGVEQQRLEMAKMWMGKDVSEEVRKTAQSERMFNEAFDQRIVDDLGSAEQIAKHAPAVTPSPAMKDAMTKAMGKQAGKASPELLEAIASGGVGYTLAVTNDADQDSAAILGFAAMFAPKMVRKMGGKVNDSLATWKEGRATVKANQFMGAIEREYARGVLAGKAPEDIVKEMGGKYPTLGEDLNKARKQAGRISKISLAQNLDEAKLIVDGVAAQGTIDRITQPIMTKIRQISPRVGHRLQELESSTKWKTASYIERVDPFLHSLGKLEKSVRDDIHKHLINSDWVEASKVVNKALGKDGIQGLLEVKKLMNELGATQVREGVLGKASLIEDYFPRMIKDRAGFQKALGSKDLPELEAILVQLKKDLGRTPTPWEEADAVNAFLNKTIKSAGVTYTGRPGHLQSRKIAQVMDRHHQYYEDPINVVHTYIEHAVSEIEKAKFFGKVAYVKDPKTKAMNLDSSVGKLLADESLTDIERRTLTELITTRFGMGEQSPNEYISGVRNLMYGGALGGPEPALTQIGDIALSNYVNGVMPTIRSLVKIASGKADITAKQAGLMNHASQEFVSSGWTNKVTQKLFKLGFSQVDNLGKTVMLQGALDKGGKLARTKKGIAKLHEKYGAAYGDEFTDLVEDLANNKLSPNVRTYLFSELTRVQPVSLSELPLEYLRNPNLRPAWMFKSFMLKQVDMIRNEAINNIAKGNVAEGTKNLLYITSLLGSSGLAIAELKAYVMGKDSTLEEMTPVDVGFGIARNVGKTFGMPERVRDQLKAGSVGKAVGETLGIPIDMYDKTIQGAIEGDPKKAAKSTAAGRASVRAWEVIEDTFF